MVCSVLLEQINDDDDYDDDDECFCSVCDIHGCCFLKNVCTECPPTGDVHNSVVAQ